MATRIVPHLTLGTGSRTSTADAAKPETTDLERLFLVKNADPRIFHETRAYARMIRRSGAPGGRIAELLFA